eukprot:11392310-Prorocentrum_lima.AAC.1
MAHFHLPKAHKDWSEAATGNLLIRIALLVKAHRRRTGVPAQVELQFLATSSLDPIALQRE